MALRHQRHTEFRQRVDSEGYRELQDCRTLQDVFARPSDNIPYFRQLLDMHPRGLSITQDSGRRNRGYSEFAPNANRRPSQCLTTNSRECHGVLARTRVNSTPRASYSAYSASTSSTNR